MALVWSQAQKECLVARCSTQTSRAQPEDTTWPLLYPVGPPPTGRTAWVGCAVRSVEVKVEDINGGMVECHLTQEEGAGACVGGRAYLVRSGRAHFHLQHWQWN